MRPLFADHNHGAPVSSLIFFLTNMRPPVAVVPGDFLTTAQQNAVACLGDVFGCRYEFDCRNDGWTAIRIEVTDAAVFAAHQSAIRTPALTRDNYHR